MKERYSEIQARVERFCREEGLFRPETSGTPVQIAAAVSGGADSMALLRLLLALQPVFGYTLSACHINHGLRGETADRDERFVREACTSLGVPLRVFRAAELGDIPAHPGEDWARRLRYGCFDRLRAENGITRVATAHTATDQAETLLFRLARGTGLHGAAGIRPLREGYCRPLLCLTRQETEAVCRALGQGWVTDETNEGDDYARNRLRHGALPALRSANSAAEENLARFCERAAKAEEYFSRQAERLLNISRTGEGQWRLADLQNADPLILETALHRLVSPERDAEEKYIRLLERIVRQGSGAVQITGNVRFAVVGGCLRREKLEKLPEAQPFQMPFLPENGAEYRLPNGWKLKTRVFPAAFPEKTQVVHKKDLKNQADYARIMMLYPALCLRSRQPGDGIRPAGRGLRKELRKWMNEAKVPVLQRETLPLLAAGSEVVWVCGGGFADGLAPDPNTKKILELELEKTEEYDHEHER